MKIFCASKRSETLSEVWQSEFPFLKYRPETLHHECTTCIRHRALVKMLSGHLLAQAAQQRLYALHLRAQYLDRTQYWADRGLSRGGGHTITCICDGMDQSKYAIPRCAITKSKEFSTFQRPRLHCSCLIIHGYDVVFAVSDMNVAKDSNASLELISFGLELLQQKGICLRTV